MANPRIVFTIPTEAKEALKRIAAKTGILEADLLRTAIGDLLAKHGEEVDMKVDRGGYRGEMYLAVVRNVDGDILEMMATWRNGKFHPHMSKLLYPSRGTEVWAGLDASIEDYKNKGLDVRTGEDKPGQVSVLVSAMTPDSPFSHDDWIKVCEGWAVGELRRKLGE